MPKKTSTKPAESKAELLDYLRQMHEIRDFEDTLSRLLKEGQSRALPIYTPGKKR